VGHLTHISTPSAAMSGHWPGNDSCRGGAYSVDQARRIEGWDWFPEEEMSEQEFRDITNNVTARLRLGQTFDIMVTHDVPFGVLPNWTTTICSRCRGQPAAAPPPGRPGPPPFPVPRPSPLPL